MAGRQGERKDRPDLVITPGEEQADGTRVSAIRVTNTEVENLHKSAKVAMLIRHNQKAEFSILGRDRKWMTLTPAPATRTDFPTDEDRLKEWHHTSPKQKWVVYVIAPDQIPDLAFRTRFRLKKKPKEPQDVLWVAVDAQEGFNSDHSVYGFTQYPKETREKRGKKSSKGRRRA